MKTLRRVSDAIDARFTRFTSIVSDLFGFYVRQNGFFGYFGRRARINARIAAVVAQYRV